MPFFRSNRPEVFCKKGALRNFAKFTVKHLCQSLFFNKVAGLRRQLYWKRDSGTGLFLRILRNFEEHLFSKNTSGGSFGFLFKGTLMQIWKSSYMFLFILKEYSENLAFLIQRILELFTREVCKFLKNKLIFNIFYCFWMVVNKLFTYLTYTYLKK